jgi:hypothetical protein
VGYQSQHSVIAKAVMYKSAMSTSSHEMFNGDQKTLLSPLTSSLARALQSSANGQTQSDAIGASMSNTWGSAPPSVPGSPRIVSLVPPSFQECAKMNGYVFGGNEVISVRIAFLQRFEK